MRSTICESTCLLRLSFSCASVSCSSIESAVLNTARPIVCTHNAINTHKRLLQNTGHAGACTWSKQGRTGKGPSWLTGQLSLFLCVVAHAHLSSHHGVFKSQACVQIQQKNWPNADKHQCPPFAPWFLVVQSSRDTRTLPCPLLVLFESTTLMLKPDPSVRPSSSVRSGCGLHSSPLPGFFLELFWAFSAPWPAAPQRTWGGCRRAPAPGCAASCRCSACVWRCAA